MNRKQFLFLTAAACTGCQGPSGSASGGGGKGHVVDAGPVGAYAADGVYQNFRQHGFFIVRKGARLFAISSNCTHRKCELETVPDRSFHCPCHGSNFTAEGHVTQGPAVRDLPVFATAQTNGHLMVTVG